ncbi:MAG: hypothetical protein IIA75_10535, partial [Proteobacteria bacterium]|nr:hypothetical protein [Pseudomonadota bacterium]
VGPQFDVRCFFANVRIGVSDDEAGEYEYHLDVRVEPKILETLDLRIGRARNLATQAKAAEAYVLEVADRLELPTLAMAVDEAVEAVRKFDRPHHGRRLRPTDRGLELKRKTPPRCRGGVSLDSSRTARRKRGSRRTGR